MVHAGEVADKAKKAAAPLKLAAPQGSQEAAQVEQEAAHGQLEAAQVEQEAAQVNILEILNTLALH